MNLPPCPPDPAAIRLPARCDLAAARSVHAQLLAWLGKKEAPAIDGSEVESLGQAMLQLLLAARVRWPAVTIAQPSSFLAERLDALVPDDALVTRLGAEA